MQIYGNEIKVQQGEDWNFDIKLSASQMEYIPYIISNNRKNPFFVITIASTKYEKQNRYVKSWWNDITNTLGISPAGSSTPTFYQTVPQYVGEIGSDDLPANPPSEENYDTRLLYQYTLRDEDIDKKLGHKPYHYYYFEYEKDNNSGKMVPIRRIDGYDCHIRFNFLSNETEKWGSQNYLYQVTLVSGEVLETVLDNIANENNSPEDWPSDVESKYKYVKTQWPDALQPDIDISSPLGYIENPEVIVEPTKLEVFNNLRRLI